MTTIITNDTIPEVSAEVPVVDNAAVAPTETMPVEAAPEVGSGSDSPIALAPVELTPEQHQAEADKAAVLASADYHFKTIYNQEVIVPHNKIAQIISEIVRNTERATHWTFEELKAVYDKVKSEI
jgi:hypothetical protein